MSNPKIRLDGFAAVMLGRRTHQKAIYRTPAQIYAQGGLFARLIDKPADDALSGDLILDGDNGVLAAELERLNAQACLADAVRWCRLSGGAVLLPIMDDSADLGLPLNLNLLGKIHELRVYAADDVQPFGVPYNDPTSADYGKPQAYQISQNQGSFVVHASRLITVSGEPLPRQLQYSGLPWQGRDVATRPYQVLAQMVNALARVGDILDRKQQAVYKMTGLAESIEAGLEDAVRRRVELTDQVRGILNTVAVDGDDEYTILDLSLTGLPETVGVYKEQLSAETGIPITMLFGRSAAGMNATGEGDFRAYYDLVDGIRSRQVRPALEQLLMLIAAQKGIAAPDNWRIGFAPLFEPTAKEQAEIAKVQAEAVATAVNIGAISENEARERLASWGWVGLNDDALGDMAE